MKFNDNYIAEVERNVGQRVQAAGYMLLSKVREKLSVPGTFVSDVLVPALTSNLTLFSSTPLVPFQFVHGSWYLSVHPPGKLALPALAGAVSNTTLSVPESWRIRKNFMLVAL